MVLICEFERCTCIRVINLAILDGMLSVSSVSSISLDMSRLQGYAKVTVLNFRLLFMLTSLLTTDLFPIPVCSL